MVQKSPFFEELYGWLDSVPTLEAGGLSETRLEQHLKDISRWVSEAVMYGFDSAGPPPARLTGLSAEQAFALAQKNLSALTNNEAYLVDLDRIPASQWSEEKIQDLIVESTGLFGFNLLTNEDGQDRLEEIAEEFFEMPDMNTVGLHQHWVLEGREKDHTSALEFRHGMLHQLSKNYMSVIGVRSNPLTDFAENKQDTTVTADEKRLLILAHEIGHARMGAINGNTRIEKIQQEMYAEAFGGLLSLWLGNNKYANFNYIDLLPDLQHPQKRVHMISLAIVDIALGQRLSDPNSYFDNTTSLRHAMGWPKDGRKHIDLLHSGEELAKKLMNRELPNAYAERMATLFILTTTYNRPDIFAGASGTLKTAADFSENYWLNAARAGNDHVKRIFAAAQARLPAP